ncbi:EF-P beta-lysylation protein EpmB [Facilibium subflavum]|uniref:EF-P beta-lysylation protein EpmB n=1 Tax=Facilibium subflavum TaxID=2219058 RepID=UPI0013C2FF9C|nr:EF-P beta-lysylation protein EpmB [Facilibium subflavum]
MQPSWKKALQSAFTNWQELAAYLDLPEDALPVISPKRFAMRVPISFVNRMKKGDVNDPLLRQILPVSQENFIQQGFVSDPLSESAFIEVPGLLHKYQNRVLLITHPACAVHCRYCFRREFDYTANTQGKKDWQRAFEYIRSHPEVDEVILSGGDPLMHNDSTLAYFIDALDQIAHVKRLRIHSRIPVVLPERINQSLLNVFENTRLQKVMVIHMNHPNEMAEDVAWGLSQLRNNHFTLLNQSTLLKGVNDDVAILKKLSESLFLHGVLPYYLHVLDKVQGAAHFEVPDDKAIVLHQALKSATSGYLVPKLVREIANEKAKTWLYAE